MSGMNPSLGRGASDLIDGEWVSLEAGQRGAGSPVESKNPARPGEVVWSGCSRLEHVEAAVAAARRALPEWSRWPRERRFAVLRRFAKLCEARAERVAGLICDEVGKVLWDAKQEAAALPAKVEITLEDGGPLKRVSDWEVSLGGTKVGRTWFRPHGVMAVVGPYNFPAHLPNGHIVPALAMGNTVVLKPSDKAPAVGQMLIELLQEALAAEGAPGGVVNLVQGGADVAKRLVSHEGLDGILFTGSWPVGRAIMEANLDRPGRILALEMGGNNAAVVMPDADLRQAAIEVVRSAFVTSGQRCTCTRRLIVHEAIADRFVSAVCKAASNLIVGDPRASHPVFMGPMISEGARRAVLEFQGRAAGGGGEVLVEATAMDVGGGGWYVTPGVMRVEKFVSREARQRDSEGARQRGSIEAGEDVEVFGPLLRVAVVKGLDEAIEQANATRYGLAASIFTKDEGTVRRFCDEVRAGCINVNTGTAGASSKLPFGGLGLSGNHRPAGAFSLDYCAYPVAGMVEGSNAAAVPPGMRFEDGWVR
ncbi:MAG: aldehyde dehydrogenase family protein [Phycisphaeraceae bacterium]|nr:aldehyde dehydrogenase family protein [Phycisphaeraceae bacterium]